MDVDEPLLLFRAQYLQCIDHDFLTWPPPVLLKQPDAQQFLFRYMFDTSRVRHRPPASYELKVLRTLIAKIRRAGGSSTTESRTIQGLASRLSSLETATTSNSPIIQQDSYITYNCPGTPSLTTWNPIILLESRSLISGSSHTGHRTWEGALHLASYLLANSSLITGQRILELGAGTGFLSILCRKYLGASSVTATDGEERVVEGIRENLQLNELLEGDGIVARKLWWGEQSTGEQNGDDLDIVLGADVIYQKEAAQSLVEALRAFLDLRPRPKILLSNALRFPDVFEVFRQSCVNNNLSIHILNYQMTPPLRQKCLFYSTAMPLQIVEIKDGLESDTP